MALTILLADDSMTAQNMGKKILTEAGYEVIAVSNGAAAVKKIAERRPDLAVLDVYMPGYTGLEVCERLKSAHETTHLPVLLTVGKMEPFKAEEGTRVKADGVIIKPFEASDLLAAIQKLQEKLAPKASVVATLHDPDKLPEYERTVKIPAPVFDEKDESYASWKSAAEEHVNENLPASSATPTISPEMQAAAAFANELDSVQPGTRSTEAIDPPAPFSLEAPTAELTPAEEFAETAPQAGVLSKAASSSFGGAMIDDVHFAEPVAPQDTAPEAVRITEPIAPPEFDTTAAPPQFDQEPELAPAPDFEPTSLRSSEEVAAGAVDPALVTDSSEMASAFPTKFGVENADAVPVGNASDYPELYVAPTHSQEGAESKIDEHPAATEHADEGDAEFETRVNAALKTAWAAEETRLDEHEQGIMLHEEMQQQFAKTISAVEPEPTQEIEPLPEAAPEAPSSESSTLMARPENAPDHQLAAAMAAAVGVHMEPAIANAISQAAGSPSEVGESTMPLDQHTALIAEVVHRVTERLKPELIEQISREVAQEMAKKRK